MRLLDLTLPDLNENLALDEALLLTAEHGAGGEVLRLWAWPGYAVVLGAAGVVADDMDEAACAADGVPVARRASGGGTVLLGPGCLNYSLVLSMERAPELSHVTASYRYVARVMAAALAGIQPGIELAGSSDLATGGRKFSGNAQQRKRRFLLHHGTILHSFELARIGRYLHLPPRRPEYRADRPHADFLMNLPDRPEEIRAALARGWGATATNSEWPADDVRELVDTKYGRAEWVRRR